MKIHDILVSRYLENPLFSEYYSSDVFYLNKNQIEKKTNIYLIYIEYIS